ncbi:helix-turn-helix domain-containing protein [Formosa haliotis]|uniref:helix-turn-helix domain-containing protein n=1 Tax=Formosa haliotis TaxID=1555194 RepID=UPI000826E944|nr:helix-turn-helix transcriptional regulator [Formosa haliotis]
MKQQIYIKNMVCERCKQSVSQLLATLGIAVYQLDLGEVTIEPITDDIYKTLKIKLQELGFELIRSEDDILIERIKTILVKILDQQVDTKLKLSEVLTAHIPKDYSVISKLFSKTMGITIEKYFIQLKIEKVKELLQLDQLQFTEIAHDLGYTSSSHLASQFKQITGMSMTQFKTLQKWDRKTLDKII